MKAVAGRDDHRADKAHEGADPPEPPHMLPQRRRGAQANNDGPNENNTF
jgi:hypothetical protein